MGFKTQNKVLLVIIVLGGLFLFSGFAFAADPVLPENPEATGGDSTGGTEEIKKKMTPKEEADLIAAYKASVESTVNSEFNRLGTTDPKVLIGRVIMAAMGILGSISLVMFVYSGFLWMIAAGDAGKAEKARDILVWSSLGLLVIFSSYAIVRFLFDIFPKV